MAAKEPIPITPDVLQWARERAGYSIEELRPQFRSIGAWESGGSFPTYLQLERLAALFQVPVAVFFFPEPPSVPRIRDSFRTLPAKAFEALPRNIRFLLRKARALQINLAELNDGRNRTNRFMLRDVGLDAGSSVRDAAKKVRDYLDVSFDRQIGWKSDHKAFAAWSEILEDHGVAVFRDAFENDAYWGFSLYDEEFPLIYVNDSIRTHRVFTLFHELAHLLSGTSGLCLRGEEVDGAVPRRDQETELPSDRFAEEFLLPAERLDEHVAGRQATEQLAAEIAKLYLVSREQVFRGFLDRRLVTRDEYDAAIEKWARQRPPLRGGDPGAAKIFYLGPRYIKLALSKYDQDRISETELAEYLDEKVRDLPEFRDRFMQKPE